MSHILIVEDDPRISSFIVKGLKSAGYTSTLIDEGRSAYALAKVSDFDLIILDVGLPGMDGFTIMKALRADGITTPIIMLTARDSVSDTLEGLENGANDYMTKPFQFAELLARIRLRLLDTNREEYDFIYNYGHRNGINILIFPNYNDLPGMIAAFYNDEGSFLGRVLVSEDSIICFDKGNKEKSRLEGNNFLSTFLYAP